MTFMMKLRALFVRHTPAMRAYFAAAAKIDGRLGTPAERAARRAWQALSEQERDAIRWIHGIKRLGVRQ